MSFITITKENIEEEHLCCAIGTKAHQAGVNQKKEWLKERVQEGHVFRKLDQRGKVFIEYAPIESVWAPVMGENFLHIYCFWVSGSFKGKGYGKKLLQSCIEDALQQNKSGVCILSSKKKKPYLSDKKFFMKFGFQVVDHIGEDYELLALSFDGSNPSFTEEAKLQQIESKDLSIYYSVQCPLIADCIEQVRQYCEDQKIALNLMKVDTLEKAKAVPCIFNNWAVFYNGKFETLCLLNEGSLKKMLEEKKKNI